MTGKDRLRPSWWEEARALFAKDLKAELRTKTAVSAVGVFTFSSLLLLGLATKNLKEITFTTPLGQSRLAWSLDSKMGLLWVLLCFAAFAGLSHSFVHEEETGTVMALRLSMSPGAVYAGKLAFNLVLILTVALVVTPVYMIMTGMLMGPPIVFLSVMFSGCLGLAATATIIAALASKARGTGALFGAIGLPFLVVFLMLLLNAAATLYLTAADPIRIFRDVGGLFSFGIGLIATSVVVFPFIWEE